ncbi:MAG TPA: AAA family ATPase [Gaiellaceae bacterium]|nr:AAA family ATPase [Gaiellaceae bacterium]
MERKLATVLFVDIVDSTALVSVTDPEIVRRGVTRFFDRASRRIRAHGGTVEKFAGDAVMAAFGVPRAHEDDALRAVRAAIAILGDVADLGLQARIGIEAGEVVADAALDSTFATGEAVNVAARLQQSAGPNEILVGPGVYRLAFGTVELESVGLRELRGRAEPVPVWRAVGLALDGRGPALDGTPLVGRESELELLRNTYERAVRDGRAHLVTIYGEAGVGKSRLAREFASTLDGATVLVGRSLPYGEGITYWPLAEMVKAAAGIADDDPPEEAHEKLLVCCEDEEVADLIGLASGVLEAFEGERSQQEIQWAVREWAENLAKAQPLVLGFEDIHWAEEPLLDLIQHLAAWVRDAPMLILCLARPELLDRHPGWGGGRTRALAIELEPLARDDAEQLADALLADTELPGTLREDVLDKTEGNPLFLEETVRMIVEGDDGYAERIPDTIQALIAARIDLLPPAQKTLLQRASVIGRVFWHGAIAELSPDAEDVDEALEELLLRDFVLRESRSTLSGDQAYRFKHVLIRDVAYTGLPKAARASLHMRFAEWLRERAREELPEIRAYHLDHAAALTAELDGSVPAELASDAAAALETAGARALSREANATARRLLLRAAELEPTLVRRYKAAVAAWRLADFGAVSVEMDAVRREASASGNESVHGRSLNALADVALVRDADLPRAGELAEHALSVLPEDDLVGRFDALRMRSQIAWWLGDLSADERYAGEALELAQRLGRKDLEAEAAQEVAASRIARLDLEGAEPFVQRSCDLAEESGSITSRAQALASRGRMRSIRGELDEAQEALAEARELYEEAGAAWTLGRTINALAWIAWRKGDLARAERLFRDSIRILRPLQERASLCESQRGLAQLLASQGKLDEAERHALEARETVGPHDQSSRATTRMALAVVRAAQGRDDEAEELFREALDVVERTEFEYIRYELLTALGRFLRDRGRAAEAQALDEQLAELGDVTWGQPPELEAATARMV